MRHFLGNIGELATCPPHQDQADAGLLKNAALAIENGRVAWCGPESEAPSEVRHWPRHDCAERLVIPGLVDCHTHLSFGGWRGDEFAQRLSGRTYAEIHAAGGGIARTLRATRAATPEQLRAKAGRALEEMLALGVTTVECKSGYGLDLPNELKQLEVYAELGECHPVDLVPTVLGAHIVPPEFLDDRDAYVAFLCDELLPEVARRGLARFCDVFVEDGAYSVSEARRILSRARQLGLTPKVHADQLSAGGGAELAAELGAVSAEHLEHVSAAGIAALAEAGTVAVSLPLASLYLQERSLPARDLLAAGVPVAVATDFNPGTAPSYHLPLALTLGCLTQGMTPQESLMGATTVAARALSAERSVGSLLPGFAADLALVDAPDLNHWLYHFRANACTAVMKNGAWVRGPAKPGRNTS